MSGLIHGKATEISATHRHEHEDYEYFLRPLVPRSFAEQCIVSLYEIPPGKSAYPYHYHCKDEEFFYILSGTGVMRTHEGEVAVSSGDFFYFPANEKGAHKLTNTSGTQPLIYLDMDTKNDLEVAVYPDSGKVGIYGRNATQLHRIENQVGYYDGE